ncbi:SDR family NAD(P)-dependent oxidoreductase [Leucothrix arctica]|uniref:Short-chain dehydrogenase n=1 Tax=Leucothrix arctica TaxID=1481894 RepID=A0A317CEW7_9GAMM|nr:SDR family NAD(P)-dependent oxidoreductase [Leucothrix arctica]PWQ96937.1 hypothetical protein DKT75_07820 [Leucothrix arctica]
MKNTTKKPRTAAITASYSGLGFELSRLLLANGYHLICIDRNEVKSAETRQKLLSEYPQAAISSVITNMASPTSITQASEKILKMIDELHLLFHVAGAATAQKQLSDRGNELHFEVNTLGPIALTKALRPVLSASSNAVVVAVGSSAMKMTKVLNVASLANPSTFRKMSGPYAQSKLAITTAFVAMSESYKADNILLRIVDPGPSKTAMSASDAMPWFVRLIRRWFPLPHIGAQKIFSAGQSKKYGTETGIYIERDAIAKLPSAAIDRATQSALMTLIEECEQASSKAAP